jgi:hypothetical protein
MGLQAFPHNNISRARQRQSRVVVQFQHLGSTVQDMRGGDAVVHLNIEEVLRADGGAIRLGDVVCEVAQGEPARSAILFDDTSSLYWPTRHPLRFTALQLV